MTDLSFIETETLLNEVFNRFDAMVVMGIQKRTKPNQDTYYRRWSGGNAFGVGLAEILKNIILEDYKTDNKFDSEGKEL